jgi:hypothetical protein
VRKANISRLIYLVLLHASVTRAKRKSRPHSLAGTPSHTSIRTPLGGGDARLRASDRIKHSTSCSLLDDDTFVRILKLVLIVVATFHRPKLIFTIGRLSRKRWCNVAEEASGHYRCAVMCSRTQRDASSDATYQEYRASSASFWPNSYWRKGMKFMDLFVI